MAHGAAWVTVPNGFLTGGARLLPHLSRWEEQQGHGVARPSEHTLQALDVIHERIESPASKLLRAAEPWSSYLVLPVFALTNAFTALHAKIGEITLENDC